MGPRIGKLLPGGRSNDLLESPLQAGIETVTNAGSLDITKSYHSC